MLIKEIDAYGRLLRDNNGTHLLYSVFFGGGTPSILDPVLMGRLMDAINRNFTLIKDAEITMECNPGTANGDALKTYREQGINRLSIGLQSMMDEELISLGRIHDSRQFKDTYVRAREAGFDNINVDIMSAIPGQTLSSYEETLTKIVNLNPEHISAYCLIIEEGTKYAELYGADTPVADVCGAVLPLPDEDDERQMYYMTGDILASAGYDRYEISNYAKEGYECRHNKVYWTLKEYIGTGLGASSYFNGYRYRNTSVMSEYMEDMSYIDSKGISICDDVFDTGEEYKGYCKFHDEIICMDQKATMEEYMFMGLRMMRGVSRMEFLERFGISLDKVYGSVTDDLIRSGLIVSEGDRLRLMSRGIDVSNRVFSEFLLD